jgi:hypothetical protein
VEGCHRTPYHYLSMLELVKQTVDEAHMREFVTWTIMSKPRLRHMSMSSTIPYKYCMERPRNTSSPSQGKAPYVFEPQLFNDILILPWYSFSASLQDYKYDKYPGPALVTYHLAGSWKNDKSGEVADPVLQHPLYRLLSEFNA